MIINPQTGKPYRKDFFKDYARGKPCLVRIANECGHGGCAHTDTTVLAHLTLTGFKAMGGKLPDLLAAWACDICHGLLDGRLKPTRDAPGLWQQPLDKTYMRLAHLEAQARTIEYLEQDGVLQYEL